MLFSFQSSRRARILLWVSNHQKGSRVSFSEIQKGTNKTDNGSGINLPYPPGSDRQDTTCPYPSGSDVLLIQFAGASCCTDVRALFFISLIHAQLDFVSSSRRPPLFGGLSFQGAVKRTIVLVKCYIISQGLCQEQLFLFIRTKTFRKFREYHDIAEGC